MKISPSLLAADFSALRESVARVERGGADALHLDVMDGMFVPNISFGAGVIAALRPHSKLFFDVHLMIEEPNRYLTDFAKAGADLCTIHFESCRDPLLVLRKIRELGMKAGLSVKPRTPAEAIFPLLPYVDLALVMTVEPGFGGQALIPYTLSKIRRFRAEIDRLALPIDLEADGGIHLQNAPEVLRAGANVLVAGSAIFGAKDPEQSIAAFRAWEKEGQ